MAKRGFDALASFFGLIVLSPILLVLTLIILILDGRPIFFKQKRVGKKERLFFFWKFRTMTTSKEQDTLLASTNDNRITPLGKWLRKYKLDELPQLWNVLKGDISFVGYRPEIPYYVERYSDEQKKIFRYKPGIVDPATIYFRNENELLSQSQNIEQDYLQKILPLKIELSLQYAQKATFLSDIGCILKTLRCLFLKR